MRDRRLIYFSNAISGNAAADALFALIPPRDVDRTLTDAGIKGIAVRHPMREVLDLAWRSGDATLPAARGRADLAHALRRRLQERIGDEEKLWAALIIRCGRGRAALLIAVASHWQISVTSVQKSQ